MKITVDPHAGAVDIAATILGHNLETCIETVPGMLADRLNNPKFLGPPHPVYGLPKGWEGGEGNVGGRYVLAQNSGINGTEALWVKESSTIRQLRRKVRKGETLTVEVWARCWGQPAMLTASLGPSTSRMERYAKADVEIDTAYWKAYRMTLALPVDDDDAWFTLRVHKDASVWIDQVHLRPEGQDLLAAELIDEIAAMRMPTLRFPGGIVTNCYHWQHGIGPVHRRPLANDAAFHRDWTVNYDFGTDEMLAMCLDQGIMPALTLNVTETPEDAGEWAAYCAAWYRERQVEPPLIYWHIGNHPYARTISHQTPEMYLDALKRFVPAVKDNYPNARIVGVTRCADTTWLPTILEGAGDLLDVIQTQVYDLQNVQREPKAGWVGAEVDVGKQMATCATSIVRFRTILLELIEACRSRQLTTNVGIAEWNAWTQADPVDGRGFFEADDALHALFVAGMIHMYAGLAPDMEVAHFYNLVNCMGILHHDGPDLTVTRVVDVFKMYREAIPGKRIAIDIDAPALGDGKALDALLTENEGGRHLFLLNFNPTEPATIELSDVQMDGATCVKTMSAAHPMDQLQDVEKPTIDSGTVTVPPLSICQWLV